MHNLAAMVRMLHRPAVYLRGLQTRFDLPLLDGDAYSEAYLAFFRTLLHLRILGISEDRLREAWRLERKLLQLLHVDSGGSPTWFLDACGQAAHPERRLLLSNYDMGLDLCANAVQAELDFSVRPPELFLGREMGEDAIRLLGECVKLQRQILDDVRREAVLVRDALSWTRRRLGR